MTNLQFENFEKAITALIPVNDQILGQTDMHFERTKITEKLIEASFWLKMAHDMWRSKDLKVSIQPKMTLSKNGKEIPHEVKEKI